MHPSRRETRHSWSSRDLNIIHLAHGDTVSLAPPSFPAAHGIRCSLTVLIDSYGHHFTKDTEGNPVYHVWWGSQPAEENEFKCPDVLTAAVPRRDNPQTGAITPISLVRQDGMVVLPTGHIWTEPSDTSTEV
jgi:hypothetical protein